MHLALLLQLSANSIADRRREAAGLKNVLDARNKMEALFQAAIDRFERKCASSQEEFHGEGYEYHGEAWEFRWGKDFQLYHWREFQDFYTESSDFEWRRAQALMNSDSSFIIPSFLCADLLGKDQHIP